MSRVDLSDPRWFPVDLHVPDRTFGMLRIDEGVLERSTFLDVRIDAPLDHADAVALSDVPARADAAPPAWLFHTSFCCSTLLARALHVAPGQVVLKEPLVLRRLGDARHAGWAIDDFVARTVSLLGRPWAPGGNVIVKPTHAALNVALDLLRAQPGSRAIVLTSGLEDFLVSNIKKTAETQAKIPALAERALTAGTLASRLPPAALAPPDLLAAAALQWAAQRDLCAALVATVGRQRVRTLDASTLLSDPVEVAAAANRWVGRGATDAQVRERAAEVATRNAKATAVPYDARQREREARDLRDQYRPAVDRALAWYERHVAPVLPPEARNLPDLAPLAAPPPAPDN